MIFSLGPQPCCSRAWLFPRWTDTDYAQVDANFRLKNKDRQIDDPSLNKGIAFIVADAPYKAHLEQCGPQTEVQILCSCCLF